MDYQQMIDEAFRRRTDIATVMREQGRLGEYDALMAQLDAGDVAFPPDLDVRQCLHTPPCSGAWQIAQRHPDSLAARDLKEA